ncbi:MAG TPA: hypothetical protein VKD91_04235, partial [Pyrinomonadaceae bacterium]|nr:hypothetical protein [Pyrinomonadaceae bacterium]
MKSQRAGLLAGALLGVVLTALVLILHNPVGFAREAKLKDKSTSAPPKEKAAVATPDEVAMGREIDRLIDEGDLKARWGVFVISPRDGHVVYSHDGAK